MTGTFRHAAVDAHQDVAVLELIGAVARSAHHQEALFSAEVAAEPWRYFDQLDRTSLLPVARQAFTALEADFPYLDDEGRVALRRRIARGFFAAHRSYLRWHLAMLGRNVPLSARDFVLEGIQRKARFAAEHHRDVRLAKLDVQALFLQGREGHERLLDRMAASPLITPGSPETSRFLTHTLSIDGPMFDSFTAAEKVDLAEWIASLPRKGERRPASAA